MLLCVGSCRWQREHRSITTLMGWSASGGLLRLWVIFGHGLFRVGVKGKADFKGQWLEIKQPAHTMRLLPQVNLHCFLSKGKTMKLYYFWYQSLGSLKIAVIVKVHLCTSYLCKSQCSTWLEKHLLPTMVQNKSRNGPYLPMPTDFCSGIEIKGVKTSILSKITSDYWAGMILVSFQCFFFSGLNDSF